MIVVNLKGGLGNQMFQWALGRNLALRNNTDLKLDLRMLLDRTPHDNSVFRDYDLEIFKLEADFSTDKEFFGLNGSLWGRIQSKLIARFFPSYLDRLNKIVRESQYNFDSFILNTPDNHCIDGYWQSEKYFKEIESTIRSDFSFKNPIISESEIIAARIRNSNSICINVRRTDYVTIHNAFIGTDYIQKGVKIIVEKIKNPEFFVFSDDIQWCQENIKLDYPVHFIGHEHAGLKFGNYMQLMTLCRHMIIPNSSFAWWAAWLNQNPDKIIIAPKNWLNAEVLDEQINADRVPSGWITV
jgi:hypothetical protein